MSLHKQVLLIGWDAADWKVINPLLEAGGMPNLARLIENGVMGTMATLHPAYSPMHWTTIATGVRPFKHGVLGFTEPTPDGTDVMPVSNLSRKVRAIWNILHLQGKTCNVVGWWPSHPAEPIRGVMVSEFYHTAYGPLEKVARAQRSHASLILVMFPRSDTGTGSAPVMSGSAQTHSRGLCSRSRKRSGTTAVPRRMIS
jgi:predicted AlkP superfamily phosphohydrolase/phosphomutase